MKTVMNHSHDGWLLKMISRTDPVINVININIRIFAVVKQLNYNDYE
jgi:hypothetical protein